MATSLYEDWGTLSPALLVTLRITFSALALALIGGVGLAIILVQSKWIELALFPFAVILQVTPIVAIAPLLLIYAPDTPTALLICAFLVAFFPILSNMVAGLKSVDHNLLNLFDLYGANRFQTLIHLKIPAAMPYFMAGLRIGGGLALIAAVVAEFAAGSAGRGSGSRVPPAREPVPSQHPAAFCGADPSHRNRRRDLRAHLVRLVARAP